ncbi:MAG: hypothetical protein RJA81_1480 [Planctomycetota bacterium]
MTILESQKESGFLDRNEIVISQSVGRLLALDSTVDIELKQGLIVVGRHPSCDISIDSVRVSRVHCCIYITDGRIFVRDLNSTNGMRINGQQVSQAELSDRDTLSIAHLRFHCDLKGLHRKPTDLLFHTQLDCAEKGSAIEDVVIRSDDSSTIQPIEEMKLEHVEKMFKKILKESGLQDCRVEVHLHVDKSKKEHNVTP